MSSTSLASVAVSSARWARRLVFRLFKIQKKPETHGPMRFVFRRLTKVKHKILFSDLSYELSLLIITKMT
jgi:hypothetical protein